MPPKKVILTDSKQRSKEKDREHEEKEKLLNKHLNEEKSKR
jgi:hypothetical protein